MWIDDEILRGCHEAIFYKIWQPDKCFVVLGCSNQEKTELNLSYLQQNGIDYYRRYGGGGSVVLYPGCVIVSLGTWVSRHFHNKFYFKLVNQSIIECLKPLSKHFEKLSQNGISDLVYENQKIAGTSFFRSRNYLLYQASVIVNLDLSLIEGCLCHPSSEPEYRRKRAHREFLTGLSSIDSSVTIARVMSVLQNELKTQLARNLDDELVGPQHEQISNLLDRANDPTR